MDKERQLFFDTNALLILQEKAFHQGHFFISQQTLQEIESIKVNSHKDADVKCKARKCAKLLDQYHADYTVVPTSLDIINSVYDMNLEISPDAIIIAAAKSVESNTGLPITFVSEDVAAKCLARSVGKLQFVTGVDELIVEKEVYTGYKEVVLSDEEMSDFYCNLNVNKFGCLENEYLIVKKSDGEIVDYKKWNGCEYKALSYKQINSHFMGKIKPRNAQQVLAFDMLQNPTETINILSGKFGSGKDYIMIANALKLIEDGKFEKMLYIRNAIGVKNANDIGFLPGSKLEKLLPYAMPLADHLGGQAGLEMQMLQGSIEIEHLGFMRGRDIKNTIIYVSEAENLTKEHVQLLIGRVGEGSALWMNGDFKQTDSEIFMMNNGLLSTVQRLAGHKRFGYIQLQKTERSETAAMADLLD